MRRRMREVIVPAYLFLCVVLGGSAQSIWGNLALQLAALFLLGWAGLHPATALTNAGRLLLALLITLVILFAVQLIPLPPSMWTILPGRRLVAEGFASLGTARPWLPISLAPYGTVSAGLSLLPPFAVIIAVLTLDACRATWAVASILGATICSVLLGYLQVSGSSSSWYLYPITNEGSAVGFFANRNHLGTLLLVAIPFIVTSLLAKGDDSMQASLPRRVAGSSCGLIVLGGIAMNGSLAAVVISVPVIAASMLLFDWTKRFRRFGFVAVAFAIVIMIPLLAHSPVTGKLTGAETSSIEGRQEIWGRSWSAVKDSFPVGTGLGSFELTYRLYENPAELTRTYVPHAHNDFLEWIVEGGLAAILLAFAFLAWWIARVWEAWRPSGPSLARAATIASAAIVAHSFVDYPMRTAAVASVLGFCISILALSRDERPAPDAIGLNLWPTRHLAVGKA